MNNMLTKNFYCKVIFGIFRLNQHCCEWNVIKFSSFNIARCFFFFALLCIACLYNWFNCCCKHLHGRGWIVLKMLLIINFLLCLPSALKIFVTHLHDYVQKIGFLNRLKRHLRPQLFFYTRRRRVCIYSVKTFVHPLASDQYQILNRYYHVCLCKVYCKHTIGRVLARRLLLQMVQNVSVFQNLKKKNMFFCPLRTLTRDKPTKICYSTCTKIEKIDLAYPFIFLLYIRIHQDSIFFVKTFLTARTNP